VARRKAEAVKAEFDWGRIYHLPVDNPKHTEVLGYHCTTPAGKGQWDQLDWRDWWIDYSGEGHLFSHPCCMYFHVRTKNKYRGRWDGTVYRVRCWHAGVRYRGRKVTSVSVGFEKGKLIWIVRTETAKLLRSSRPRKGKVKRGK
jgi:hypothetical protein